MKLPAAFWLGSDRLNIRRSELLQRASLPVQAGQDNAQVTTAQFFALWMALEALRGPDVGLELSQVLDGAVMPPSFLISHHARNLQDALARLARFKSLCAPEEVNITTDTENCSITVNWPFGGVAPSSLTDATMISILGMARSGTDTDIIPRRVELRRGPSEAIANYFRCPIRWNARHDRMVLSKADLSLPFQKYNKELLDLLDKVLMDEAGVRKISGTIVDQLRWLLRRTLAAGRPELRSVARELAISERSLQRRLGEEGHSFQSILADVRHELAREHLSGGNLDIAEIAYTLGYDDQGSFYRAFQKWENRTPAEWREDHKTSPASQLS